MSAEAAHQEATAAKDAARDLDPAKTDEPSGAGAALLVGGLGMLSPAHIASLQRLAGNAGLAQMLHSSVGPRRPTVQRCGPGHPDCGCEPEPVQRNGENKLDPQEQIKEAIDPVKGSPELVVALGPALIAKASQDQRLSMIDMLNDRGGFTQKAHLPDLWDTFGKNIIEVASANPERWKKSFAVAAGAMRASNEVSGQQKVFYLDVEDIATRFLDQNDAYCKQELTRLGLTEDGTVPVGAPTEEQEQALKGVRDDAAKLAADQEAQRDLRNVVVGYSFVESPPGGVGPPVALGGPVTFDPERPPGAGPQPEDKTMRTWQDVKASYDDLDVLIRARLMVNPALFPLVRGAHEDSTKTAKVATGERGDALSTLGAGLKEVMDNITKTRGMVHVLAPDLEPIHGMLLAGTQTVTPDRNWNSSPFFATLGKDLVDQHAPGPWWQVLGLAAAEMAAYVVAGIATGGTALAIGLAAKGVANVALSAGRADALLAASQATITPETKLVTEGQVDEAQAAVIESAAFALLDVAFAAGGVRTVLRSVMQYEKVAAEAAAKAAVQAERLMAKQAAKDAKAAAREAKTPALDARHHADEAAKAADEAKRSADSAGPGESARAAASAKRAEASSTQARQAADDLAAVAQEGAAGEHAPPRQAGEHTLSMRGDWVTRCSPEPCAELATSVAGRAKVGAEALNTSGLGERAKELFGRFSGSRERASRLAQQSRKELAGVSGPARLPVESRLLDEGAAIEHEVQALERQVQLESMARGTLGKAWGDLVKGNVADRTAAMRSRMAGAGATDIASQRALVAYEQRAKALADDAARLERSPTSFGKPRSEVENDLALKWKELDKALEGAEREELARASARGAGGTSFGESDRAVREGLEIPPGGKAPDIARNAGSGTMLLAESKGSSIADAFAQFESAMNAPIGRTFSRFELQIYVKWEEFEAMARSGKIRGFPANNVGGSWFITGPLGRDGNAIPVQILKT